MDWKEFAVALAPHLAWPVVAIIGICVLRGQLKRLAPTTVQVLAGWRVKSLKLGVPGVTAEIERALEAAKASLGEVAEASIPTSDRTTPQRPRAPIHVDKSGAGKPYQRPAIPDKASKRTTVAELKVQAAADENLQRAFEDPSGLVNSRYATLIKILEASTPSSELDGLPDERGERRVEQLVKLAIQNNRLTSREAHALEEIRSAYGRMAGTPGSTSPYAAHNFSKLVDRLLETLVP